MPQTAREAGARRVLRETAGGLDDPLSVPVATAAADLLDPVDAFAHPVKQVWSPLHPGGPPAPERVELTDLDAAWPYLPSYAQRKADIRRAPVRIESTRSTSGNKTTRLTRSN